MTEDGREVRPSAWVESCRCGARNIVAKAGAPPPDMIGCSHKPENREPLYTRADAYRLAAEALREAARPEGYHPEYRLGWSDAARFLETQASEDTE